MTGLEKIIQAIETKAMAVASDIVEGAKKEAEEIKASARSQAEIKCAEIAEESSINIKSVLSRAESGAGLQRKKMLLETKQSLINEIIEKAKLQLLNLPRDEYFQVILKLIKKYAHREAGRIVFSSKDKERIPNKFEDSILDSLSELSGAALTIADECALIDGGFILVYGEIEENCSFDALFAAYKEELQDIVNSFLFVEGETEDRPVNSKQSSNNV